MTNETKCVEECMRQIKKKIVDNRHYKIKNKVYDEDKGYYEFTISMVGTPKTFLQFTEMEDLVYSFESKCNRAGLLIDCDGRVSKSNQEDVIIFSIMFGRKSLYEDQSIERLIDEIINIRMIR